MNNKKVLVTGATGFTGSHAVPLLIKAGYEVFCFVRSSSNLNSLPLKDVELVIGDLNDQRSLNTALKRVEILVNIASLGFGHAQNIVNAAVEESVSRAVFFSTTSIFTTLDADSKKVRLDAEERIKNSDLAYTILRPTMIYGTPQDRNICKFIKFVNKSPVFPIFGSGEYKLQPVHVDDVAGAVVNALASSNTRKKAYNISGGSVLTLKALVDLIAKMLDKSIRKFYLPKDLFIRFLEIVEYFSIPVPITSEQIQRFNEDKDFDYNRAEDDFGFDPRPFYEGLKEEIQMMGLLNKG
jgi:nucleoside-diphosphate-sugar epimerase